MNGSVNTSIPPLPVPGKSEPLSRINTTGDSQQPVNKEELTSEEPTFEQSMKLVKDELQPDPDANSTHQQEAESGKELPLDTQLPETAAKDHHTILFSPVQASVPLQSESQPLINSDPGIKAESGMAAKASSTAVKTRILNQGEILNTDQQAEPELESSERSVQDMRSVKTEAVTEKGIQLATSYVAVQNRQLANPAENGNTATVQLNTTQAVTPATQQAELTLSAEKPAVQLTEIPQINLAGLAQISSKGQLLSSTLRQQQLLSTGEAPALQSLSSSGETGLEKQPLLFNSVTNPASTSTFQLVHQAEIVESFSRPNWSHGMGKQILWMVNQNINTAEIKLNPAHLGPIEVLVDVQDDQVNVSLSSRHTAVREAMEQALPRLREMLNENGFNLADADISQQSFAEQRENNAFKHSDGQVSHAQLAVDMPDVPQPGLSPESNTMVDYYI